MLFAVFNASNKLLATCGTYLEARFRWGEYISTCPAPSDDAGIFVSHYGALRRLDVEGVDRVAGVGSPEERQPTHSEILDAILA